MEMETKMTKHGNSYAFAVPKAFINCKVLDPDKRYKIEVTPLFLSPVRVGVIA